ncbi:MAG: helix-turn-helix transcriptional regulator [Clostridia bacterium]|nr:helix-turn-helix transcriptional regulator [Clostridia bacterium]
MEELKNIIASNISSLRKKNRMTQADLAEKLCYSDKAISKWERGESIPDVIVLKQVADMFSVSVDYLLEEHAENEPIPAASEAQTKRNKLLISAVSSGSVWLIATVVFVLLSIMNVRLSVGNWMIFVYAIPVFLIVLLVFNSLWGNRTVGAVIVSALMWSILLCICLSLRSFNAWLLLVIGIPAQIIVILSFAIGRKKIK